MVHYIEKTNPKTIKFVNESHEKPQRKNGFCVSRIVEFCKRTDLHGYKYIVMENLNLCERGCWAVVVLVSTAFAAFFVVTAYNWFARNPIVTVIESTQGAIWDIPFPAVTICNLNIISRKAARHFADSVVLPMNTTADDVFEALRFAPLLHSSYIVDPYQKEMLIALQAVLDLNSITIEVMFKTLSPASSCNQLVQRCMWKNTIYRCDTLFTQTYTFFAICCSFNYFAVDSHKVKGSAVHKDSKETPRRVASCGYQTALTVVLDTKTEDYFSTAVASQGALVFIDNAFNVADLDSPVRLVNPGTEVLIALSPERTYATSGLRAFKPADRRCYYQDEVSLGNFRQYSFHNCIAYQRVEYIKKVCDCIPFYFPLNDYHRICNFNDLECLQRFLVYKQNTSHIQEERKFQCLPECEHYEYPLEVALGKLAPDARLDGLPFFNDLLLQNCSLLNVFFNDLVSTRYRRDVYLNWQNLLASFGGLLSLMLGFTLIAGFDLILFFTFGLAYSSIKSNANTGTKGNKIYVQEYNNKNIFLKKNLSEKQIDNWQFEKQSKVKLTKY